jgi:diketogulonate reductase-like aldo/keto reductase
MLLALKFGDVPNFSPCRVRRVTVLTGFFLLPPGPLPVLSYGDAAESGVTFFDTADMYSGGVTEEITGRLLGKLFGHRGDYVLATKLYFPTGPGPNDRGLSRKHVLASIDASMG